MTPAAHLPRTIVADDLTGACDTGALFAARGPVPVTVWPDPPLHAPVTVVDTESRTLDPVDAARRVSGVARNLARTRFFKKIDSTLRGPIGAELDALLELDAPPLLVGAAGLALALARRLGLATARVDPPAGERWLIVAGSQHPATRRQVEAAREAGLMVLATPDAPQADRAGAVAELAAQARARLDAERIDVAIVTGGHALVALSHALRGEPPELRGGPRPAPARRPPLS